MAVSFKQKISTDITQTNTMEHHLIACLNTSFKTPPITTATGTIQATDNRKHNIPGKHCKEFKVLDKKTTSTRLLLSEAGWNANRSLFTGTSTSTGTSTVALALA